MVGFSVHTGAIHVHPVFSSEHRAPRGGEKIELYGKAGAAFHNCRRLDVAK